MIEKRKRIRQDINKTSKQNRRDFLGQSGLGLLGMLFCGSISVEAKSFPISLAVEKLVNALGCKIISNNISQYISSVSAFTYHEVIRVNRMMAEDRVGRFTDLSGSKVYSPNFENEYFFYPVRSQDGINTCVAFFDKRRPIGYQRISLIEGPTLFGIGQAAEDLSKNVSGSWAKKVFLPRERVQEGRGGWQKSYTSSDIYVTSEGEVESMYYTTGDNTGSVIVKAIDERGFLLSNKTYQLRITT